MLKKGTPVFLFLVMFGFLTFAQEKAALRGKKAEPGTYQFIVSAQDSDFIFTDDLLVEIENRRMQDHEVTWNLTATITIQIASKNEIHQPGFHPKNEMIIRKKED